MKNILVTGGAGFIGSHICTLLLQNNYKLTIVDSLINSSLGVIKNIEKLSLQNNKNSSNELKFVRADLRDYKSIRNIFEEAKENNCPFDGVIHLAGLKSASESVDLPLIYWDTNLIGSINLFKIMDSYNCKTIIFSSSASIYGLSNKIPFKEENIVNPISPYGNTKSVIEKLLNDLYKSSKSSWKIVCLRYFNPIGAHPSGEIGEDPNDQPNNIFPLLVKVAQGKINQFKIYGNDWPTKDGTPLRDYIHVMDLAKAHFLAFEYLEKNGNQYLEMNIGTGKGTSVFELIKIFQEVNQVEIPYIYEDRRKGDTAVVYADNLLASKILNWRPERSIEEMCRDGWNWQLKNPNGYGNNV